MKITEKDLLNYFTNLPKTAQKKLLKTLGEVEKKTKQKGRKPKRFYESRDYYDTIIK